MQSTGEGRFEWQKLMLIWHWTILKPRQRFYVLALFCFVMCLEMIIIINCDTLNWLMFYWLGPAVQRLCNVGKKKFDRDQPFCSFSLMTEK